MDDNGNGAKNSPGDEEVEEHGSSREVTLNIYNSGYHRQNIAESRLHEPNLYDSTTRLAWSNGEARQSGEIVHAGIRAGLSGNRAGDFNEGAGRMVKAVIMMMMTVIAMQVGTNSFAMLDQS